MVSELNSSRLELRKIEYYKDGRVGLASRELSRLGARLGSEPVPTLAEINSDSQFVGEEISLDEFESQWSVYV